MGISLKQAKKSVKHANRYLTQEDNQHRVSTVQVDGLEMYVVVRAETDEPLTDPKKTVELCLLNILGYN